MNVVHTECSLIGQPFFQPWRFPKDLRTSHDCHEDLGPTEVSSEDVSDGSDGVTDNLESKYYWHNYISVEDTRKG